MIGSGRHASFFLGACVAVVCGGLASAKASVLVVSPELPLLDIPYVTGGTNCFTAADLCVSGGSFTLTSVTSNKIVGGSELITTEATYSADVTLDNAAKTPVGMLTLTGTAEQEVLGRIGLFFYPGTWTVDLLSMSMTGSFDGGAVTLALDPGVTSSGTTSVTSVIINNMQYFDVSSFFDVTVDLSLSLPGKPKLTTTRSGTATATAPVPEPATLALLVAPLLAIPVLRRRRR
jgi:hypothetical protein